MTVPEDGQLTEARRRAKAHRVGLERDKLLAREAHVLERDAARSECKPRELGFTRSVKVHEFRRSVVVVVAVGRAQRIKVCGVVVVLLSVPIGAPDV